MRLTDAEFINVSLHCSHAIETLCSESQDVFLLEGRGECNVHCRSNCLSFEKYKGSFIDIIKVSDAYGEFATRQHKTFSVKVVKSCESTTTCRTLLNWD